MWKVLIQVNSLTHGLRLEVFSSHISISNIFVLLTKAHIFQNSGSKICFAGCLDISKTVYGGNPASNAGFNISKKSVRIVKAGECKGMM